MFFPVIDKFTCVIHLLPPIRRETSGKCHRNPSRPLTQITMINFAAFVEEMSANSQPSARRHVWEPSLSLHVLGSFNVWGMFYPLFGTRGISLVHRVHPLGPRTVCRILVPKAAAEEPGRNVSISNSSRLF